MDTVATFRDIITYDYIRASALLLVFYDHILTFNDEFRHIWSRPKRVSSIAFFFHRYLTLVMNLVVIILMLVTFTNKSCIIWDRIREFTVALVQINIGVLLFWRTWAIYGLSRQVFIILSIMCSVVVALSMWLMSQVSQSVIVEAGCYAYLSTRDAAYTAGAWEALLFFDCIIFILTVMRTYKDHNSGWFSQKRISLTDLLLRDGSMYFVAMAFTNLANILFLYFATPVLKSGMVIAANNLSAILMSRLVLNLQKNSATTDFFTSRSQWTQTSDRLVFGRPDNRSDIEAHEIQPSRECRVAELTSST